MTITIRALRPDDLDAVMAIDRYAFASAPETFPDIIARDVQSTLAVERSSPRRTTSVGAQQNYARARCSTSTSTTTTTTTTMQRRSCLLASTPAVLIAPSVLWNSGHDSCGHSRVTCLPHEPTRNPLRALIATRNGREVGAAVYSRSRH